MSDGGTTRQKRIAPRPKAVMCRLNVNEESRLFEIRMRDAIYFRVRYTPQRLAYAERICVLFSSCMSRAVNQRPSTFEPVAEHDFVIRQWNS